MIDFARYNFHPVIKLPKDYEVYDFTRGYDPSRQPRTPYGVGRYNEDRRGMYDAALFQSEQGPRTIHMGIDIGTPVGEPVHAFYEGEIFLAGYNAAKGDYGHTLITRHVLGGEDLYALHGHLSERSTRESQPGRRFHAGEVIAWVGDRHENGGWNPHLHFQLSLIRPEKCDLPGVVTPEQRAQALKLYPDPRLVLGPLYS
jgi:murein DD-endopeptidase MepM/ murein hydrolase activator NlpD